MSPLLHIIVALYAALASAAPMGTAAESEPVIAHKGTLVKYAGGPMNTAFISGNSGKQCFKFDLLLVPWVLPCWCAWSFLLSKTSFS